MKYYTTKTVHDKEIEVDFDVYGAWIKSDKDSFRMDRDKLIDLAIEILDNYPESDSLDEFIARKAG